MGQKPIRVLQNRAQRKKEELGWLRSLKVYYGQKSKVVTKASLENYDNDSCPSESLKTPKRKDLSKHHMTIENIRKRAKSYNQKLEKGIMDKHMHRSESSGSVNTKGSTTPGCNGYNRTYYCTALF